MHGCIKKEEREGDLKVVIVCGQISRCERSRLFKLVETTFSVIYPTCEIVYNL